MTVYIDKIHCPSWSHVALGWGLNVPGDYIHFVGDAEPMRRLGEILRATGMPVAATVEDWQLLSVNEPPVDFTQLETTYYSPN